MKPKLNKITAKDAKKIVDGLEANIKIMESNGQHDLAKRGKEMLANMPAEIRELLKGGH